MTGVVIDQYPDTAQTPPSSALATENILMIRYGGLKSFIQALPAMAMIKHHHPDARLTLLTTREFVDIGSKSGYFDEILVDKLPPLHYPEEWIDLYRCFNSRRFTRVYDLQMNARTWAYYRLFRRKPRWAGMLKATPFFYGRAHDGISPARKYHELMKASGIDHMQLPDLSWMEVDVSFYDFKKPPVLLVLSGDGGDAWGAAKYAGLALKLTREGHDIALIGGDGDHDAAEQIRKLCPDAKDLTARTSAYDIASLSRRARAVIGGDSAALHLAALMEAPVVMLLSAETDASLLAPAGLDVTVIQAARLDDISVADVYAALRKKDVANAG